MNYDSWRISFQSSEQAARSAYKQLTSLQQELAKAEAEKADMIRRCTTIGNIALRWIPDTVKRGDVFDGHSVPTNPKAQDDRERVISILAKVKALPKE